MKAESPFELEIILHYHCCIGDHKQLDTPAGCQILEKLLTEKMLLVSDKENGTKYKANREKVSAFVEGLLNVNFPVSVQKWIIPND